ncbi:hypothetical protein RIR_jg8541.t1 [Rhizophagus irregularis DAOM 181602=DAOM 197198]|nr:hypothetical protein RIR_jg8541.t1 [Rhizophagus irregularis DAOM 181602=DAOM 197198]
MSHIQKNATEEQQEGNIELIFLALFIKSLIKNHFYLITFHVKSSSYGFSVPYNIDDFDKSSNQNTSKMNSIIEVLI